METSSESPIFEPLAIISNGMHPSDASVSSLRAVKGPAILEFPKMSDTFLSKQGTPANMPMFNLTKH